MNAPPTEALAALGDIPDYRVCSDDTDPRGWKIIDANNVALGEVTELIIDLDGLIARYIVCAIERNHARSVLIPTGFARIENDVCTVHLDFLTVADIDQLPSFEGLPLSSDHAAKIERVLTGAAPKASAAKIVRRSDERRTSS
jgi:PRC-barrel domain